VTGFPVGGIIDVGFDLRQIYKKNLRRGLSGTPKIME